MERIVQYDLEKRFTQFLKRNNFLMNRDILDLFVLLDVEFNFLSESASINENTESLYNSY